MQKACRFFKCAKLLFVRVKCGKKLPFLYEPQRTRRLQRKEFEYEEIYRIL